MIFHGASKHFRVLRAGVRVGRAFLPQSRIQIRAGPPVHERRLAWSVCNVNHLWDETISSN